MFVAAGLQAVDVPASMNENQSSISIEGTSQSQTTPHKSFQQQAYWKWLAWALAIVWLATCLLWWYLHRKAASRSDEPQPASVVIDTREAVKKLKKACAKQAPQQAKSALLMWAKSRWPDLPPTSLGAIQSRCEGALQLELGRLNEALYQRQSQTWSGTALWQAFKAEKHAQSAVDRQHKDAGILEPLYKI